MLKSIYKLLIIMYGQHFPDNDHIFMDNNAPFHRVKIVCLYLWGFASHSRIFHSYVYVTIAGERLQILTYARHSLSLSSEGSLASHTNCETRHPFIMVISEDPWHTHPLPSAWQWRCHYLF